MAHLSRSTHCGERTFGSMELRIRFPHGLGDCTYFAHQMPLYLSRGHNITVVCSPDKDILFRDSGVSISHEIGDERVVSWHDARSLNDVDQRTLWAANKAVVNLCVAPMPDIGTPQDLWTEYCQIRLDLRRHIPPENWTQVEAFLEKLPRPIVLVHTTGNSNQGTKSLPAEMTRELYKCLLNRIPGTLILLDWDNRVSRLASYRVRHLTDDWEWLDVPRLMALLDQADLILGIDSGPLHAARFTDTPAIGMFPTPDHYPVRWCLPRNRQVNVVPRRFSHEWNKRMRIAYNIVECPGASLDPSYLADVAARMLAGPRYLDAAQLGADLQLQQFVLEWERGGEGSLSHYVDRHNSYDRLFMEIRARFKEPFMVETGCIRAEEDWGGAGFSTYLLGAFLHRYGGRLLSLDNTPDHCAFARQMVQEMSCVTVECRDSLEGLATLGKPVDVLLLDSWDTDVSGFAEHALKEIQMALPWLHSQSLVLFDDTVYQKRHFTGKGELAVPWLLDNGWEVLYSGYQTLLQRRP
jgi:hypothetical protein